MAVHIPRIKTLPTSRFINLETYISKHNFLFTKAEGCPTMVGRVYEMSPLVGGGADFSTVIHNVAKVSPEHTTIQVSMIAHPDYDAEHVFARNKTHGGSVVQRIIRNKQNTLANSRKWNWNSTIPPINQKTVIISTMTPIRNWEDNDTQEDTIAREGQFLINLKSCGFDDARVLDHNQVVAVYRQLADLYSPRPSVELDPEMEIKFQAYGPDNVFDFREPRVGRIGESTYVTCVTPKSYRRDGILGLMNIMTGAPFMSGSALEGGGDRIMSPFVLSTEISILPQRPELNRLRHSIDSRKLKQDFVLQLGNEDPKEKLQDLELLQAQCAVEGNKIVQVSMNMFIYGRTSNEAMESAGGAKSILDKLEFDARIIYDNILIRFSQMMPMNYSTAIAKKLASSVTLSATAAGTLLPVYGDNTGNVSRNSYHTGSAYLTNRGSVFFFDPFASDTHYGGLITGEPGAGKSVALQDFVITQLAMDRDVILFDNGRSAKKLCLACGGEYNEIGSSSRFTPSFNPFTGLTSTEFNDQKTSITELLMLMAYEDCTPDDGAKIALLEAVTAAYERRLDEAEITDVVESLENIVNCKRGTDHQDMLTLASANLIPRLKAFINNPKRSKYFLGHSTLDTQKQFVVFEIGMLGDDEHLKKCVMFFLLNSLLNRIKNNKRQKVIIIDEAHDLIEDERAGAVMEGLYLKGRKEKVSIWIVVQSLLKLARSPSGETILRQSAWKLILQQPKEEISAILAENLLTAYKNDPHFATSLENVHSRKGRYCQILIVGRRGYETVNLILDKWTATLLSSEGQQRDKIFQDIENGIDAEEATDRFVNDQVDMMEKWLDRILDQLKQAYGIFGMSVIDTITRIIKRRGD